MMGLFVVLGLIKCKVEYGIICGKRYIKYIIENVRLELPEAIESGNYIEEEQKYKEILQIVKDNIITIE